MAVLNLPKATEHLGLFKHERWPRGAKARTSYTLMTSGHTSQTAGRLIRVFIYIYLFLLPVVIFSPPARSLQLTLTADSVKNNSVKLSIKFMVLGESKSKKNRQPSLWNPKRTNSGDLSSNNNKYNNTSGPAKTCLHEGQGGVMANPCWSRGRSIQSFAHNFSPFSFCFAVVVPSFFFFLQLLPMIFRISRNTRIQDAERLTFFRSRPLFSCKAIAIHITKIIPCLLRQPSPSVCPLEEKKKKKKKKKTCCLLPYVQLEPMDQDDVQCERKPRRRDPRPTKKLSMRLCAWASSSSSSSSSLLFIPLSLRTERLGSACWKHNASTSARVSPYCGSSAGD